MPHITWDQGGIALVLCVPSVLRVVCGMFPDNDDHYQQAAYSVMYKSRDFAGAVPTSVISMCLGIPYTPVYAG